MSTEPPQLPQLELLHRMQELPLVELALNKSASTYTRFKDSHPLVKWALSTAESSFTTATRQAAPYAKKLETPIHFVDHTLCRGLDHIEKKVPIVKQRLEKFIFEDTYVLAVGAVGFGVLPVVYANDLVASQATMIKDISWNKVNQILGTEYGIAAVQGLDSTAFIIEMMIDKYFPPIGVESSPELVSVEEDKFLHTLQTVGRLSNKAAHRVYGHVVHQLRTLNRESLKAYLTDLVGFLQITRYISLVGRKADDDSSPTPTDSSTSLPPSRRFTRFFPPGSFTGQHEQKGDSHYVPPSPPNFSSRTITSSLSLSLYPLPPPPYPLSRY